MTLIHVVEDDRVVAQSIVALLKSWGIESETFATGEAFLDASDTAPDCVLLDLRLPGLDGLDVLGRFRETDGQTPVIVMTGHGDVALSVDAMRRGAQDFVEKPFDGDDLVERIRSEVDRALPDMRCRQLLDRLTPREGDVLRQVMDGHPNKVIAHNLGISPKTVELHRARVMAKTGARSVAQLARIALRGGVDVDRAI